MKTEEKRICDVVNEDYVISSDEIETVIKYLPKGKACGDDNISAEYYKAWERKD